MKRRWKTLSQGESEYAYWLWCRGYTMDEIALALFVSRPTVFRAINGRPKIKGKIAPYRDEMFKEGKLVINEMNASEIG